MIIGKYAGETDLTKKHLYDAGLDIASNVDIVLYGKSRELISTGIKIAVPEGFVGLLWSRSGLSAKYGIEVGAGCIDSTYRGELKVLLYNHSKNDITIKKGDRIAQLLTVPVKLSLYTKVDSLDETDRGEGGFGSTGT